MDKRLKNLYRGIEKAGLDGLLVCLPENITYVTRYRSRDSYLLVSGKKSIYFTDPRYTQEAKKYLRGFSLKEGKGSLLKLIAEACLGLKLKRLGIEEMYFTCGRYQRLKELLENKAELKPASGIIEAMRQIKDADELDKIRKAARIAMEAMRFAEEVIRPGMKELELAGEIERFIRYNGGYSASFDTIVASGAGSAFPHYLTSDKKIAAGEPVLIDMGVDFEGYKSDLTRVFFSDKISLTFRKVYSVVQEAQKRAIKAIKPGVFIDKIDTAARQYIAAKGYGGLFSHSLGHGVGLQIHEAPRIAQKEKIKLKPGMVFTLEPAVYVPGKFGVRIEDMVLVTKKGCEVISGSLDQ